MILAHLLICAIISELLDLNKEAHSVSSAMMLVDRMCKTYWFVVTVSPLSCRAPFPRYYE